MLISTNSCNRKPVIIKELFPLLQLMHFYLPCLSLIEDEVGCVIIHSTLNTEIDQVIAKHRKLTGPILGYCLASDSSF